MSSNTTTSTVPPTTDQTSEEDASAPIVVQKPPNVCDECGHAVVKDGNIREEWVCEACGLLHEVDDLDRSVRARLTDEGKNTQLRGAPTDGAYTRNGLGSQVGRPREGENLSRTSLTVRRDGEVIAKAPFSQHQLAERLYRRSKQVEQRGKGKAKRKGLSEVRRLSSCLDLPRHVRDQAGTLYRQASQADLLRGHNIDAIAAGTVFVAAYVGGAPRPYDAIAERAHCDADAVRKEHQHLVSNLSVAQFEPAGADLIEWYAAQLASTLPADEKGHPAVRLPALAKELLEAGGDAPTFRNRAARTRAAAALYLAGNRLEYSLSQQAVADVVAISVDSVRDAYPALAAATADARD